MKWSLSQRSRWKCILELSNRYCMFRTWLLGQCGASTISRLKLRDEAVKRIEGERGGLWLLVRCRAQSCPTLCDPVVCSPPGSSPWDSPGNTRVGCHALLYESLTTKGGGFLVSKETFARCLAFLHLVSYQQTKVMPVLFIFHVPQVTHTDQWWLHGRTPWQYVRIDVPPLLLSYLS